MWANIFMSDLSLQKKLGGTICLYDIDIDAALRNQVLGNIINNAPNTLTKWYNHLEKSGFSLLSYALLKGDHSGNVDGCLDCVRIFNTILEKSIHDHLNGICKVTELDNMRSDFSLAY